MTRLYLIRHGDYLETVEGKFFDNSLRKTAIIHWVQVDYPSVSGVWVLQTYHDDRHLEGIGFEGV